MRLLNHLVRNSVDHGIETPDVRLAAGKPAGGTMTLQAYNEQAMLHRNGKIIPLIEATTYLDSLHNSESIREAYNADKILNIMVFLYQGNNWGLCVDEVFAYMDIVIKPMDSKMNPLLLFSGVAVLGNGDLALVMNPKGLLDCYLQSIKEIAIDNARRAGA